MLSLDVIITSCKSCCTLKGTANTFIVNYVSVEGQRNGNLRDENTWKSHITLHVKKFKSRRMMVVLPKLLNFFKFCPKRKCFTAGLPEMKDFRMFLELHGPATHLQTFNFG